jgi:prepilin-type N-terminal cleavage/methylation domain-containing protein
MSIHSTGKKVRKGFTLVELAVVIVIIGVLAAFGVPKFLNSVERSKAAEAFGYLSAIREANERYIAQQGIYAVDQNSWDVTMQPPKYFAVSTYSATQGNATTPSTWTMTLTRDVTSSSKGAYTVTFTQDGFDSTNSTITANPEINPMGTTATTSS